MKDEAEGQPFDGAQDKRKTPKRRPECDRAISPVQAARFVLALRDGATIAAGRRGGRGGGADAALPAADRCGLRRALGRGGGGGERGDGGGAGAGAGGTG